MNKIIGALAAAGAALLLATSANAAPLSGAGAANEATTAAGTQLVNFRGYRHCHWRSGRRWCHGGLNRRGSGISIYIGPRYKHHRRGNNRWGQRNRNWR